MKYVLRTLLTFALIVSFLPTISFADQCQPFPKGVSRVPVDVNGSHSPDYMYVDSANGGNDYIVLPRETYHKLHLIDARAMTSKQKKLARIVLVPFVLKPAHGQTWAISINGCKLKEVTAYVVTSGDKLYKTYGTTNASVIPTPPVQPATVNAKNKKSDSANKPGLANPISKDLIKGLRNVLQ